MVKPQDVIYIKDPLLPGYIPGQVITYSFMQQLNGSDYSAWSEGQQEQYLQGFDPLDERQ